MIEPADVVVPVEHGDPELQPQRGVEAGRGHRGQDGIEEGLQRLAVDLEVGGGRAGPGVGVEDRELQLILGGLEVDEEVVDLVEHLGRARVRAVDLVDDHDRRQPGFQRLLEHEARLGQRALGGVDQQEHPVDQRQRPLDLGAEVGVAGGVHDVDVDVLVVDGRVLGHDGDALLALQVHRVHDSLGDGLILAEEPRLPEHGVDQGGLAVVDVGDDRNVTDAVALLHLPIVPWPRALARARAFTVRRAAIMTATFTPPEDLR